MNIEIKKIGNKTYKNEYVFLVDGKPDEETNVYEISGRIYIHSTNNYLLTEFKQWTISNFKELSIGNISFNLETDSYYNYKKIEIDILKNNQVFIIVEVQAESEVWNKPFSITQFANEIELNCHDNILYHQDDKETLLNGFGIALKFVEYEEPINRYIDMMIDEYENICQKSEIKLFEELNKSSLISYFNFPHEIEAACKQYLVYFTEFLKDIGINAESNISTHRGQTLFTVKPEDKTQALALIKDTLNMYLNLPSSTEIGQINILHQDIGVQQLMSNIQFLQSQIMLGNAILQAKNSSIESLELTNYQLKQIVDSKDKELLKYNQGEEIIDGIVRVNKYESKGFTIDLGELLRRIKRKLN
jgi:hypothetical protein